MFGARSLGACAGFNGAAIFQPRKYALDAGHVTRRRCASMGPRLFSRGNVGYHEPIPAGLGFQWGRDFSAAEMWGITNLSPPDWALQWGRGFSAAEIGVRCHPMAPPRVASMGPRLFSRGNVPYTARFNIAQVMLQWGRDFSAAEMAHLAVDGPLVLQASMGPRLFSRGNAPCIGSPTDRTRCFNGAAAFQPRKCGWLRR